MRYKIKSTGNGAFYTITRLSDGACVFLEGDDALEFEKSLETTNERFTDDDVCALYDDVMKPAWTVEDILAREG